MLYFMRLSAINNYNLKWFFDNSFLISMARQKKWKKAMRINQENYTFDGTSYLRE